MSRRQQLIKRALDVAISIVGLVIVSPLLLLASLLIKFDSKGPVLHATQRLGLGGRSFTMLKFRTMHVNSPPRYLPDGSMLVEPNDPRITCVGKLLRIGFDELPQLINVLKGDMSLVGPRPDMLYALGLYQAKESKRLLVRPGITGLAQVSGRTDIPWRERLACDIEYVENWSLWLDLQIAVLTVIELIPPLRRRFQRMPRFEKSLPQD